MQSARPFPIDYAPFLCYSDIRSEGYCSENEFLEGTGIVRELRVNQAIRAPEILLIGANGERLGVMPVSRALQMAREQEADLVEVAPNAQPPVCRILDYGKFKYEQARREREARKRQRQVETRQVRFRPKISSHDMELKARTTEKLLREGDKVKVSVMFRGREVTYSDLGRNLLEQIYDKVKEIAAVEKAPSLEGRFMSMVLTPTVSKMKGPKETEPEETAGEQQ
jgi:translation initiation factor IF-3